MATARLIRYSKGVEPNEKGSAQRGAFFRAPLMNRQFTRVSRLAGACVLWHGQDYLLLSLSLLISVSLFSPVRAFFKSFSPFSRERGQGSWEETQKKLSVIDGEESPRGGHRKRAWFCDEENASKIFVERERFPRCTRDFHSTRREDDRYESVSGTS